eukprot:11680627-Ditylum_brightwellii.AAC.1
MDAEILLSVHLKTFTAFRISHLGCCQGKGQALEGAGCNCCSEEPLQALHAKGTVLPCLEVQAHQEGLDEVVWC